MGILNKTIIYEKQFCVLGISELFRSASLKSTNTNIKKIAADITLDKLILHKVLWLNEK